MKTRPLLDRHPNSGPIWKLHAGALMLQGKDSLQALRRAGELLPSDAETQFYLGNVLHDHGDLADAIASLHKAIALKPDFAEAHDSLGMALQAADRPGEAGAGHLPALEPGAKYAGGAGDPGDE